jgi:subtilisin family serine protease
MAKAPDSAGRPARRPKPPAKLDEAMLRRFVFQTFGRARRTQDSPIVPDVWLRYIRAAESIAHARIEGKTPPGDALDLLLTPWSGTTPGYIAQHLRLRLDEEGRKKARIAQSTSRVVACIDFFTLVRDVVPLTGWWQRLSQDWRQFQTVFQWLYESIEQDRTLSWALSNAGSDIEFFRYAALVGFIDRLMNASTPKQIRDLSKLAQRLGPVTEDAEEHEGDEPRSHGPEPRVKEVEVLIEGYEHAVGEHSAVISATPATEESRPGAGDPKGIFLINLNRPAAQNLFESRMTVKADAAYRVFDISTEGIAFAVVDGGVDATHPGFLKKATSDETKKYLEGLRKDGKRTIPKEDLQQWSRVVATYDFTILRDIVASGGDPLGLPEPNRTKIANLKNNPANSTAFEHLRIRNENARDLDWQIVDPLIRVVHDGTYAQPGSDHGTHVAGILAADLAEPEDLNRPLFGMCRALSLYDLRVFDALGRGDEFAILCAIEFIDWLNRDRANPVVHGVNLSLALAHDVDSFACGQTPICEACNHLVGAGTVVVAAAGNTGFEGGVQKQSLGSGYRAISITDPGNADRVITVGSTHRRDPHAYGVSYFSARGPTGDGRRKPDILAPGEKITSIIRDGRSQRMDGTSMAAPHVSGAAALLMARYPELIGHPLRIKDILMRSATDLNREPSFQGAGLLDVLRALQSV